MTLSPLHRRLGLLALAVSLAWILVARGYADYLARVAPDRALALNAGQPVALMRTAELALSEGRLDDAQSLALRALRTQPFDGKSLRILGAVAQARGDRARALGLMQMAAATTPRESGAQFWLAINALAEKDIDAALLRFDRLLRFEPEVQDDVFPILALIAVSPDGLAPLSRYLAADPPWRSGFISRLLRESESSAALGRLFKAIGEAGGQVTQSELDQFAARLFARREWPRLRRLVARMDGSEELLRDGGFDGTDTPALLGWHMAKVPGVDIQTGAVGGADRALRLVFLNRRVPFQHVSQSLLLLPGNYILSGRARSIDLQTALGLSWVIRCVDSNSVIGESARLLGTHDWHAFAVPFAVPPDQCGGQVLTLVLAARIAAEQQIAGEAWFDDLTIESATPASGAKSPQLPVPPAAALDAPAPAAGR